MIYGLLQLLEQVFFFAAHVSEGSFQKPLTREEEKEYIERLLNGDEEARRVLIERNLRLVAHIVKKYSLTLADTDDLISIGTIGLIKAVSTFDFKKGAVLSTYASRCIENEILMSLRAGRKYAREVSINEPIGKDKEGNEIALVDILGSCADAVFDDVRINIDISRLKLILKKTLTQRERIVIELRYGLNGNMPMTQQQIADRLEISRSYVSRRA
ncbi:MAG: RNA polymerase sporulation sigma factor SigK [Christensenellales bacterium]|jgi:RNA polymerase sporulation-specific sigma factor